MKLEATRAHALPLETLRRRLEARAVYWSGRYPSFGIPTLYRWTDERTARASYRGGDGTLWLEASAVRVSLELPFFARIYQAKIEAFLARELEALCAPEPPTAG